MKTTFLKKYFRSLSSLLLLLFFWGINLFCIFFPSRETYRARLFQPSVISQPENEPFFHYTLPQYMIGSSELLRTAGIDENIKEWTAYLKGVGESSIRQVLYDGWIDIDSYLNGNVTLDALIQDNEDLAAIKKANPAACEYMIFAKKAENFLKSTQVEGYNWNETPTDPKVTEEEEATRQNKIKELFQTAKATYPKIKDDFLKMRYAYQMVTLRRYMTESKEPTCSALYDKYITPLNSNSILKYWALLHKASDFIGPEADYYYAQVFNNCSAKRARAKQLYTHSKVDSILLFAKNDQEKAAVWVMSALTDGKNIEKLQKVYQYAPNSKNLELLLSNEISKIEDWVLTEPFTNFVRDTYDAELGAEVELSKLRADDKAYSKTFQTWVQKVIAEQKVPNPALWHLANAHLYYINQEWAKAQEALAIAEKAKGINDNIRNQISTTRLLSFALDNGKISPSLEQKIYKDLVSIQRFELPASRKPVDYSSTTDDFSYFKDNRSHLDNILIALANRYENQGDVVKAGLLLSRCEHLQRTNKKFVTQFGIYDDYFFYLDEYAKADDLKNIINMLNKDNKSQFEYFLTSKVDKEYFRICDLYGTILFRDGEESKALQAWKEIPDSYWTNGGFAYKTYLNESPFERSYFNPHDVEKGFFTKPIIVAKILEYKQLAESKPDESAKYNYLIANAYYNISAYGTAWMCTRYGWSSGDTYANDAANRRSDDDNYLLLKNAIAYYKKAAETAKDKSFAALCYRLTKDADELREGVIYESTLTMEQRYDETRVKPEYVSAFKTKLKKEYSEFYDGLINDCGKLYEYERKAGVKK